MFSWVQLVKFLVIIGVLAGAVLWVHRTSEKQAEKSARKNRDSRA
jgi:hypothetical protein